MSTVSRSIGAPELLLLTNDAAVRNAANTFSLANKLKARDTNSSSPAEFTLAYDTCGNQTDDGTNYTYIYDAFGRVRKIKHRATAALVSEHTYNGLGFRIGWHYDANADAAVDGDDPWYWFTYDDQWRVVATFRAEDADPMEVFVHHAAGLGGTGGSSYIDSVILRDRHIAEPWTDAADNKRTERRYYAQNWRADVSAILTDGGSMVEWVKYSAYGVPFALPAGDTDSDGDWDVDDKVRINAGGTYDVRKDPELDGDIDATDVTHADSITGGYQALGRGVLSSGGVGGAVSNRRGYAGYEYAPELEGSGAAGRHLYHVRHRLYDADMGRWTRRDPLGYVDGMGLYEYVKGMAVVVADPLGLMRQSCATGICQDYSANSIGMPGDKVRPYRLFPITSDPDSPPPPPAQKPAEPLAPPPGRGLGHCYIGVPANPLSPVEGCRKCCEWNYDGCRDRYRDRLLACKADSQEFYDICAGKCAKSCADYTATHYCRRKCDLCRSGQARQDSWCSYSYEIDIAKCDTNRAACNAKCLIDHNHCVIVDRTPWKWR